MSVPNTTAQIASAHAALRTGRLRGANHVLSDELLPHYEPPAAEMAWRMGVGLGTSLLALLLTALYFGSVPTEKFAGLIVIITLPVSAGLAELTGQILVYQSKRRFKAALAGVLTRDIECGYSGWDLSDVAREVIADEMERRRLLEKAGLSE